MFLILFFLNFSSLALTCNESLRVNDFSKRNELTFVSFGDFGHDNREHSVLAEALHKTCAREKCDFAVTLGDNIYESGVKNVGDVQFQSKFEKYYQKFGRFDFWMILGNHDVRGNKMAQVEYSCKSERWRMPAFSYLVPKLPDWLKIYGIDTSPIAKDCSWFCGYQSILDQFKKEMCPPSRSWKFLFGHHPIASAGRGFDERNGAKMRDRLLPLIGECGVHIYYSGHDHHQEHIRVDYRDVRYDQIIQGAAAEVRGEDPKNFVLGKQHVFAKAQYGFAITKVNAHKVTIKFYGIDGKEIYSFESELSDRVTSKAKDLTPEGIRSSSQTH